MLCEDTKAERSEAFDLDGFYEDSPPQPSEARQMILLLWQPEWVKKTKKFEKSRILCISRTLRPSVARQMI